MLIDHQQMAIGKQITLRLTELVKTPTWLAQRATKIGPRAVSPAAISILVKRDSQRSVFTTQIARALGVEESWLTQGMGRKERAAVAATADPAEVNRMSEPARNLGMLFDCLPTSEQRALWSPLVRLLTGNPELLRTYLQYPAADATVKKAFGTPGVKAASAKKRRHPSSASRRQKSPKQRRGSR